MSSVGMVRYFLPVLTAPFYYASLENEYSLFNQYLPDWFVITNKQAIIDSYEGTGHGNFVPWRGLDSPIILLDIDAHCTFLNSALCGGYFSAAMGRSSAACISCC